MASWLCVLFDKAHHNAPSMAERTRDLPAGGADKTGLTNACRIGRKEVRGAVDIQVGNRPYTESSAPTAPE